MKMKNENKKIQKYTKSYYYHHYYVFMLKFILFNIFLKYCFSPRASNHSLMANRGRTILQYSTSMNLRLRYVYPSNFCLALYNVFPNKHLFELISHHQGFVILQFLFSIKFSGLISALSTQVSVRMFLSLVQTLLCGPAALSKL